MAETSTSAATLTARLFDEVDGLESHCEEWDRLAVLRSRPTSAPAWALGWWRHLRPPDAELRVVLVWSGSELVGVLPLYQLGETLHPLGNRMPAAEPLALPGMEEKAAAEMAELLHERAHPARIELELEGGDDDWAELLAAAWPGQRPLVWLRSKEQVPQVSVPQSYADWFSAKSKGFRRDMRRGKRKVEDAGCAYRLAASAGLERDLHEFLRLHRARLEHRGGSDLSADGVHGMLREVGHAWIESGRFQLLLLECEGSPIAAEVTIAAGDVRLAWAGGFDERFARLSPSMQCLLELVRSSSEAGYSVLSLGAGDQSYKNRLASTSTRLSSCVLVPRAGGHHRAVAHMRFEQFRRALGRRLPAALRSSLGR